MKTMWITTGLVIGIGIAATVAATDGTTPSRIVPAEVPGDSTNLESTTIVVEIDDSIPGSTSTTAVAIHPFVSVPATTPNASPTPATTVASTPVAPVPSTTPLPSTTFIPSTTSYWKNVGDPCDSPGASGVSGSGVTLICIDGSWQPAA